jgi:hypothetical protein
MIKNLSKTIALILIAAQLSACGTILHPERKGQVDGRIDPSIAVLNGIGLLFFLVPGVIAFAVDFNNGTIYLPNSADATEFDPNDARIVKTHGELTPNQLQAVISAELGQPVDLTAAQVRQHAE